MCRMIYQRNSNFINLLTEKAKKKRFNFLRNKRTNRLFFLTLTKEALYHLYTFFISLLDILSFVTKILPLPVIFHFQ